MPDKIGITWNIESVRVTGFISENPSAKYLEAWLVDVAQNDPTQVTKGSNSFLGVARSDDGFLRVDSNDRRIDINLNAASAEKSNVNWPLAEYKRIFETYALRFSEIQELPLVNRLALGFVFTSEVSSEADGLAKLQSAISRIKFDNSIRDFLYRANIPLSMPKFEDLLFNRLATWSLGQLQTIQVKVGTDGSKVHEVLNTAPMAIRLEVDVNTSQATDIAADANRIASYLSEMQSMVLEIAVNGEPRIAQ